MNPPPELQVIAPGASVDEVAAIVGALEFASALARGAGAGVASGAAGAGAAGAGTGAGAFSAESNPWVGAGLREGVDRAPALARTPAEVGLAGAVPPCE